MERLQKSDFRFFEPAKTVLQHYQKKKSGRMNQGIKYALEIATVVCFLVAVACLAAGGSEVLIDISSFLFVCGVIPLLILSANKTHHVDFRLINQVLQMHQLVLNNLPAWKREMDVQLINVKVPAHLSKISHQLLDEINSTSKSLTPSKVWKYQVNLETSIDKFFNSGDFVKLPAGYRYLWANMVKSCFFKVEHVYTDSAGYVVSGPHSWGAADLDV